MCVITVSKNVRNRCFRTGNLRSLFTGFFNEIREHVAARQTVTSFEFPQANRYKLSYDMDLLHGSDTIAGPVSTRQPFNRHQDPPIVHLTLQLYAPPSFVCSVFALAPTAAVQAADQARVPIASEQEPTLTALTRCPLSSSMLVLHRMLQIAVVSFELYDNPS